MAGADSRAVLDRVALPGGEVRVLASVVTERILEVALGERVYRDVWDPRETGTVLFAGLASWDEPAGDALSEIDRDAVLDALWAVASAAGGIRAIVSWPRGANAPVAWRWDRGADGFLVRVEQAVDVLLLGRTMRMPCRTSYGPAGEPIATARLDDGRWVYPGDGPVDEATRALVRRRLERAVDADFVLTSFAWRFTWEAKDRPDAAAPR